MAWYKYISVEVPLLMCTFSMMLQMSVSTNLYIYRTCYTILGYNKSECSQLGNEDNNLTHYLEPKVQPTVNQINMVQSTIMSTVPLLFCMYVGTWSDKFGRKPFMMLSLIGITLSSIMNTVIIHFPYVSTWWFIITTIPCLLTGGMSTLMISISTYVADVTNSNDRAVRLSVIDVIMGSSAFAGSLLSSPLLYATNYEIIYMITSSLMGLSILYTYFLIPESLANTEKVPKLTELFSYISVTDIMKDTFKKRKNNARPYILAILGLNLLSNFTMGEMSVLTMFLRAKFYWTLPILNTVSGITSVVNILATVSGTVLFYKIMKIKEIPIALFSIMLTICASVLRSVATNDIYIYVAYACGAFRGLFGIMFRTILSYMVAPDDMGKIFAVQGILFSVDDTLSNLLYTNLYNATLNTNSAAFNFLSAGISTATFIVVLFMMKLKFPYYETSPEVVQPDEDQPKEININANDVEVLSIKETLSSKRMSLEIIDVARTLSLR